MPSKFEDLSPRGGYDWLVRELKTLRDEVADLRTARSAEATTVGRGGITIKDDGSFQMVDDNGVLIVYFGPDEFGRQVVRLRREGGHLVMFTDFSGSGNQFWAFTDLEGRIIVSDDAGAGKGMARPWLPVHLFPTFVPSLPAAGDTGLWTIDSSKIVSEVGLWEGRMSISHPRLYVDGVWGNASGSGAITYRLRVNEQVVGTWTGTDPNTQGPFDVADMVGLDWSKIQVTAQKPSGTGAVRCHVLGSYLAQSAG